VILVISAITEKFRANERLVPKADRIPDLEAEAYARHLDKWLLVRRLQQMVGFLPRPDARRIPKGVKLEASQPVMVLQPHRSAFGAKPAQQWQLGQVQEHELYPHDDSNEVLTVSFNPPEGLNSYSQQNYNPHRSSSFGHGKHRDMDYDRQVCLHSRSEISRRVRMVYDLSYQVTFEAVRFTSISNFRQKVLEDPLPLPHSHHPPPNFGFGAAATATPDLRAIAIIAGSAKVDAPTRKQLLQAFDFQSDGEVVDTGEPKEEEEEEGEEGEEGREEEDAAPEAEARSVQFNILDAHGPHRYKVSQEGEAAGGGWTLRSSFFAFDGAVDGTVQFNILDATDPHRYKVSTDGEGDGWTLQDSFWAFTSDPGNGAVQFNILDSGGPHRYKVSQEGGGKGWTLRSSFWGGKEEEGKEGAGEAKAMKDEVEKQVSNELNNLKGIGAMNEKQLELIKDAYVFLWLARFRRGKKKSLNDVKAILPAHLQWLRSRFMLSFPLLLSSSPPPLPSSSPPLPLLFPSSSPPLPLTSSQPSLSAHPISLSLVTCSLARASSPSVRSALSQSRQGTA
jgi:hypothetical protein